MVKLGVFDTPMYCKRGQLLLGHYHPSYDYSYRTLSVLLEEETRAAVVMSSQPDLGEHRIITEGLLYKPDSKVDLSYTATF